MDWFFISSLFGCLLWFFGIILEDWSLCLFKQGIPLLFYKCLFKCLVSPPLTFLITCNTEYLKQLTPCIYYWEDYLMNWNALSCITCVYLANIWELSSERFRRMVFYSLYAEKIASRRGLERWDTGRAALMPDTNWVQWICHTGRLHEKCRNTPEWV